MKWNCHGNNNNNNNDDWWKKKSSDEDSLHIKKHSDNNKCIVGIHTHTV